MTPTSKRAQVAALTLAGKTAAEIATTLAATAGSVKAMRSQLRRAGVELPKEKAGRRAAAA